MSEKALKICPFFKKKLKSKFSILEYFTEILLNELHAPYFYTHHLICKNFHFVCRGVQGGPKTLKKILLLSKNYFNYVCKKTFLIKAKKIFCTVCPNSAARGGNIFVFIFSS